MRVIGLLSLFFSLVACDFIPEEAAQVEVIDSSIHGQYQGIYIKVNGIHRDNGEEVYMQVNLNVDIQEGNVMVNGQRLPFAELTTMEVTAEISEIKDGLTGNFEGAAVTVNFFLHEQFESELDQVARAFRLETQIIETDKYDVHMFNVTEVVIELDSSSQEIRRTVTLISESESKIQAARECPMFKCAPLLGCAARKKDSAGCQTCECAAMMQSPIPREPVRVVDTFEPSTYEPHTAISCGFGDYADKVVHKFQELPFPLRIATITLLTLIAAILTATCCLTVCCRKSKKMNKTNNLKAFGIGKLQIYVPDNEKKQPLIDNLDVVSADIA
ncbi:uncharacterized protein LOC134812296 isoform X2 [Bolinopsis microptera]|uniref:uncharacterized protein LOC134812296 isoform X2 n=1 Tax=Bolinopsis microptera TaxID=2820187 RepID=UPI0030794B41